MNVAERGMKTRLRLLLVVLAAGLLSTGCRQQMAQQPYYRPYEESEFFADHRASRPLERGVIHRGQYLESDPLMTGFTREEWGRIYSKAANPKLDLNQPPQIVDRDGAVGLPRFDQRDPGLPKVYAEAYPFEMTPDDLTRGQERYTIYCSVCHGALGNGQGKIWERGYLTPTSFHTEIVGEHEVDLSKNDAPLTKRGISRGYALWEIQIPLREVPVGYMFEVVTRGYGGMPSYSAQIPPADRWRIVAYVRALQHSQHAPAGGKQ